VQSRFKDHRFVAYEMFVCVAAHWWREFKFELKLNKKQINRKRARVGEGERKRSVHQTALP